MADIFDMTDTWNNGATTFTAIKMDVTDTASAAGSLLMDLQVGGASKLSIAKNGAISVTAAQSYTAATIIGISQVAGSGLRYANDGGYPIGLHAGPNGIGLGVGGAGVSVGGSLGFGTSIWNNVDTFLQRDAADILAQRRSTNPQAFRLYNTYTDASNYERGFMRWSSNVLEVGAEAAGTGSARNLRLYSAVTRLDGPNGTGLVSVTSANTPLVTIEQSTGTKSIISPLSYTMPESSSPPSAPSANNVIIYAEDNGSGKTRLMALFATGAAQQIAIEP